MNATPVTFFDVLSAMRDRRELHFTYPNGSEVVGVPSGIHINSRVNRLYWAITVGVSPEFRWSEVNDGAGGFGIIREVG